MIYLDHNATSPMKPQIIDLVTETMKQGGNASAVYKQGRNARRVVELAREQVAALVGVNENQVVFNAGATEANNTLFHHFSGRRVWATTIEHPSVKAFIDEDSFIPVTPDGVVDMDALAQMLETQAAPDLVSVMMVNNETGAIQSVEEIARMVKKHNPQAYVHTDATQATGRLPVDFGKLQVDYLSLSSHKIAGPQGVGALIFAPGTEPQSYMLGAGQEKRMRAGTENVPGIAGFGLAAEMAVTGLEKYAALAGLRDELEARIADQVPEAKIFGMNAPRVSNTTSLCYTGMNSKSQLMNMDLAGVACSSGAACSSGTSKGSAVLRAMGASEEEATSTLRVSMGWNTTKDDVEGFWKAWFAMVQRCRQKNKATA